MTNAPSRKQLLALAAALLLACVAASFLVFGGSARTAPAPVHPMADPAAPVAAGTDVVTFMVAGDSITADHAFPEQVRSRIVGHRSWVNFAQSESTAFVGGWAVGGATTAEMAAGLAPGTADILVILGGTNDIFAGVPHEEIARNMHDIVSTAGADRVLVSSVPPRNGFQEPTLAYNAWLQDFVLDQGWDWVDAAAGLRDPADPGRYAEGLAYDGIHPTLAGAEVIGTAILGELSEQPTAVVSPAPVPPGEAVLEAPAGTTTES